MIIQKLIERRAINPPRYLADNTHYLTITGSVAFGIATDDSDLDIYGFCIPPKDVIFPPGIPGFGKPLITPFEQWQQHHVPEGTKVYDFTVYNIVKFFNLSMHCNPTVVGSLFTPRRCVLHSTMIGEHVRANRKLFLHKGAMHRYRGYLFSQMSKIKDKTNSTNPKRAAMIEQFGYDLKYASHAVRLGLECEQILVENDLDVERNSSILNSVRRGEWTLEQVEEWTTVKERSLETLYATSTLQHAPDEVAIGQLLMECLETHYGTIERATASVSVVEMLNDMKAVVQKYERMVTHANIV